MSDRPMFVFKGSSEKPYYRVICQDCGWKAEGSDHPDQVYPQADSHTCDASARTVPGK